MDICIKQEAVLEFLFLKRENTATIPRRLVNIYVILALDISAARECLGKLMAVLERMKILVLVPDPLVTHCM